MTAITADYGYRDGSGILRVMNERKKKS